MRRLRKEGTPGQLRLRIFGSFRGVRHEEYTVQERGDMSREAILEMI
jgi:hypothetical protein